MAAYRHAYYDARILHRDISAGNILITGSGGGLLIDWDLSKSVDADSSMTAPAERTVSVPLVTGTIKDNMY